MSTCEWIIDSLKEWVLSLAYATEEFVGDAFVAALKWVSDQNYLQTSYVDRGPLGSYDWETGDFTKDGAWHDLDLSAIVPAGTKAVAFSLRIKTPIVNKLFILKPKGLGPAWYFAGAVTQIADMAQYLDLCCACDVNRKIEYNITPTTWTYITLTVKGWWI